MIIIIIGCSIISIVSIIVLIFGLFVIGLI